MYYVYYLVHKLISIHEKDMFKILLIKNVSPATANKKLTRTLLIQKFTIN